MAWLHQRHLRFGMNELPQPTATPVSPGSAMAFTRRESPGSGLAHQVPLNPFDVSRSYALVMRLALLLAVLPGLGTGFVLVLVAGVALPLTIAWPQLAQAHGQIQALGFVLLFIVAVGLQLFPRFLSAPLRHPERAIGGRCLVAVALLGRLVAQPLEPGGAREALLVVSTLGVPVGALVAGWAFHGFRRAPIEADRATSETWRTFITVGGPALGAALVLYVWSGLRLASGDVVVAPGLDEALIHLELAGFATCLVLAVASRVFGRFLLLRTRPGFEARLPMLAALWAAGLVLVSLGWLLAGAWAVWLHLFGALLELGVLAGWLWLIGLYDLPSRESGTPYVTSPTRRWVRLAFAFLVLNLALEVGLFGREVLLGVPPSNTELSAARHALAQGFLLPLMVSMAARLLPIFSADVLKHRRRLEISVDLLLVGALVRVLAEALGGYGAFAGPLVALGGALGVLGFYVFAFGMWRSLDRLPKPRATFP